MPLPLLLLFACAPPTALTSPSLLVIATVIRGLDNAGKTTVVKQICGEDITTVSPTLGFEIRTVEFEG